MDEDAYDGSEQAVAEPLRLDPDVVSALREDLREVSGRVVAAVIAEVPSYSRAFAGPMGETISNAVAVSLGGFLDLASREQASDASTPLESVIEGAYGLGRGEARSERSMDALLSAYRVGARVAWRGMSGLAVEAGLPAGEVAQFAELVFAYIDQLSAASVAGHADELETRGRVRQRLLGRLARQLVSGAPADAAVAAAERAEWPVPETLTAVVLPTGQVRGALAGLPAETFVASEEVPGLEDGEGALILVPDAVRSTLARALGGRQAVIGPTRPWLQARESFIRAMRARELGLDAGAAAGDAVDTDEHLVRLVLEADPVALADLRARALAPLSQLRPATADKLAETLRAWLLHQGRREDVAAALFVHAQTVRYRMGQLRELYGERLEDPETSLELTVALGVPAG